MGNLTFTSSMLLQKQNKNQDGMKYQKAMSHE